MIECINCVMNDTIEEFKIHDDGICNFCHSYDEEKFSYTEDQIDINLENIKKKIRQEIGRSKYDCVIGLSGGTDSSYAVYLAWKLGINPLIIHMDNGWNSKISNQNINKMLEKTNFDFKTLILDWEEFKELQISFLKAGVPDIELLTDHAIFAYILNFALKNKIKYVISGINFATEHSSIPSWGWRKDDFKHINKIHKKFSNKEIKSFPKMYPFKKFFYEKIIKKIEYINILDNINYNSTQAKKVLNKVFDWEDYGGKHHESFFTKFFQGYILPKKFNIDKRLLHLSCLIRNNEIKREEAKNILLLPHLETQKIREYKSFFLKKLSLSSEEFDQIISSTPKKHSNYSLDVYNNTAFRNVTKILKKVL